MYVLYACMHVCMYYIFILALHVIYNDEGFIK